MVSPGARGGDGGVAVAALINWLRRSFIAGFFVTVPLVISVFAFVWIFRLIDNFVGPLYAGWAFDHLGHGVPFYTGAAIVILTITIGTTGLEQFIPAKKS